MTMSPENTTGFTVAVTYNAQNTSIPGRIPHAGLETAGQPKTQQVHPARRVRRDGHAQRLSSQTKLPRSHKRTDVYCSVCGSKDVTKAVMHTAVGKGGELRPAVSVGEVGVELGSLHRKSNTGLTYDTLLCLMCRNVVKRETSNEQPILVSTPSRNMMIVIPYFLAMTLRTKNEIQELVSRYRGRFERIFKRWLKTAQNECKGCRVGAKITIAVRNFKINCWVIVEPVDVYYVRLSYGGAKIICP